MHVQRESEVVKTTSGGQVKNALARAAARSGAGLIEVQLPLSRLAGGPADVAAAFNEALTAGRGRVKLAVIDHISSFPPFTFPVQQLCSLCRAAGAKGAHARLVVGLRFKAVDDLPRCPALRCV